MLFSIAAVARLVWIFVGIATPMQDSGPIQATISPNDNRIAAGQLDRGVLTVHLEARTGIWQPDGPTGRSLRTAAFAEVGKTPETPGPLLRVPVGTEIRATVRNALLKPMWLFGMGRERALVSDSIQIAPGTTRDLHFRADTPGAYYYAASTDHSPITERHSEDSQLGGAIIVDPTGARPPSAERIFVITGWLALDSTTKSGLSGLGPDGLGFVFNGRSYPGNERLELMQGDSAHWRFINLSTADHPLHLHGFYFRVEAKGDGKKDTLYSAAEQRMAVTEYMLPGQTMAMSWSPTRSGNWVFHCHFAGHISPWRALEADRTSMTPSQMGHEANHMRALVLGIRVKSRGAIFRPTRVTRTVRLIIRSRPKVYGSYVGYSYALGGTPREQDPTMQVPGPVLDLVRGERVAVNIVNQSHEGAAVHWHGIELESYPDGVPGVSGTGRSILPLIRSGDSLTVRFTPPRAGTFIYHSHTNEFQQITSGLYGALIVRPRGELPDPAADKLLLISDDGPLVNFVHEAGYPAALLNGQRTPDPIDIRGGTATRLRLINIRSDFAMAVSLLEGQAPAQWRIIAKDGMPTTRLQSVTRPATIVIAPGETYDLEINPPSGATLALRYGLTPVDAPPAFAQVVTVPVRVH